MIDFSQWSNLNWFDGVIIGIIALSIIISFFRGFVREAISLVTWGLAILLGLKFATDFKFYLTEYISSPLWRYVAAFLVVFFVILVIGTLVSALVGLVIKKIGIGFFDRLFGVVFGAARGILTVSVILLFISLSSLQKADWVQTSLLTPHFKILVSWLNKFLPDKLQQVTGWVNTNTDINA